MNSLPSRKLHVLVLAGGPDREHEVSLMSGAQVAAALRDAGHDVLLRNIHPDDLEALEEFAAWRGDVIFPALHGKWGEGGGLQTILDTRKLCYVGCSAPVAQLCMDKARTKRAWEAAGLATPAFELVPADQPSNLAPPVVVKPVDEGSSFDLAICHSVLEIDQARRELGSRHHKLMVEQYVSGIEVTVGIVGRPGAGESDPDRYIALPPLQIVPAAAYYDYQAKYVRDDTRYIFDIDLPHPVLKKLSTTALAAHCQLGAGHLSRVDFIIDKQHQAWLLEINTIPGFTSHSLLPMAARKAGLPMPKLVDQLVQLAAGEKNKKK